MTAAAPGPNRPNAPPPAAAYPREQVAAQAVKALRWFSRALHAHGRQVFALTDRDGTTMVVCREDGSPAAAELRLWASRWHVTPEQEVPGADPS